jgi:aerobic carbon-monoxide dehydrogenase medium subunit
LLPAAFEYHRPDSVAEAVDLLARFGEDGKVLAGGMSFIPLLKLRFAQPGHLIDVNRIPELSGISESDGWLRIKAISRHAEIARSEVVKASYPAMATAAPLIADPIVRNMGTMAGSLAHGDPAGDWGSVMLAMGGQVVAACTAGERVIAVDDLLVSNFNTSLRPDELITEVRVPTPTARSGGTYLKLERKVGDFATVGVAVHLTLDDGHIAGAGIGLTSVGPRNIKAAEAEAALAGAEPTEEAFAEAARLAAGAAQPVTDVRGSAAYKRHVVEVFVRRALGRALEIARGE